MLTTLPSVSGFNMLNPDGTVSDRMEEVREEAAEWTSRAVENLGECLLHELPQPPEGAQYSHTTLNLMRIISLCVVLTPVFCRPCCKLFIQHNYKAGAVAVVQQGAASASRDFISWTVMTFLPIVGINVILSAVRKWDPKRIPKYVCRPLSEALQEVLKCRSILPYQSVDRFTRAPNATWRFTPHVWVRNVHSFARAHFFLMLLARPGL
jgi:hypothetical protein